MEEIKDEIWMPIKGFENAYCISNTGKLRSVGRYVVLGRGGKQFFPERIIAPSKNRFGYFHTHLDFDSVRVYRTIHRLVATTFILNPENKPWINHKNGIKTDNRIENLEWCTASENNQHAIDMGLRKSAKGEAQGHAILTERQVVEIRETLAVGGITQRALALRMGIGYKLVNEIYKRKSWKHI